MVEAKLLAMFIIVIVVVAVLLLLAITLNQRGTEITKEGINKLTNIGICGINTLNNKCSEKTTDKFGTNCIFDSVGNRVADCTLCEREEDGNLIYKCSLPACGCGFGWKDSTVPV